MAHGNKPVDLLQIYKTRYRQFATVPYYDPRYSHHFPFFGFGTIDMMMRDSRVLFGLGMLKGPIFTYTRFFTKEDLAKPEVNQAIIDRDYFFSYQVDCEDERTRTFILDTLNEFWMNGVAKALKCIEWGYSPCQVIYGRDNESIMRYKNLVSYVPNIARPVSKNHELIGIHLKNTDKYIPMPKSCVFIHQREYDQFIGRSKLFACHIPWHETWQLGGARDIRRMWYYRNAYDSGTLYFPEGSITDPDTGEKRSNAELALEIMDATQTGSYRILPKPATSNGKNEKTWDFESPKANTTPDGILEYPKDLRLEILEGLGIPREVVESEGSQGFGSSSGRAVPFMAFIASLQPIVSELLLDFRMQILNPLLLVNDMSPYYKLTRVIPIVKEPDPAKPFQTQAA